MTGGRCREPRLCVLRDSAARGEKSVLWGPSSPKPSIQSLHTITSAPASWTPIVPRLADDVHLPSHTQHHSHLRRDLAISQDGPCHLTREAAEALSFNSPPGSAAHSGHTRRTISFKISSFKPLCHHR